MVTAETIYSIGISAYGDSTETSAERRGIVAGGFPLARQVPADRLWAGPAPPVRIPASAAL
jgi:hypothetical protein